MKKIVLINHTFQIPRFYRRWELFAQEHPDLDVTLLAPVDYRWDTKGSMIFGEDTVFHGRDVSLDNFKIKSFQTKNHKFLGWTSSEMVDYIKKEKPDLVYHIGVHNQMSLMQCIWSVRRYVPHGKVVAFSMRGPAHNLKLEKTKTSILQWVARVIFFIVNWLMLKYFNQNCDALLCHYPDAVDCFRKEGYKKPIYISTQVGVNPEYYHPDEAQRQAIREKLHLDDAFVFGAAARFIPSKGLFEIVDALPQDGNWKCLLMGKGTDDFTQDLKDRIVQRNLQDKIILTGYLEWDEIAKYWNAIDCALHVPQTTKTWVETFSLAVVQAMATGKAIIGNTSGSVPYQIGPWGVVVPEGDIIALSVAMQEMICIPHKATEMGEKLYQYAIDNFSIGHLNDQFYDIIMDIMSGTYNRNLIDMTLKSATILKLPISKAICLNDER